MKETHTAKAWPGLDHSNVRGGSCGEDRWFLGAPVSTRGSRMARRCDGGGHDMREDVAVAMGGRGAASKGWRRRLG